MNDSYIMLKGKMMQERHQGLIRQVERENLVRDIKPAKTNNKSVLPLRVILVAIINWVAR